VLERRRLIRRNPVRGKYSLWLRLLELGMRAVTHFNYPQVCGTVFASPRRGNRESAHLGILGDTEILAVASVDRIPSERMPALARHLIKATQERSTELGHVPASTRLSITKRRA
jgi:DNA-binding IclR family transcriptional regulator